MSFILSAGLGRPADPALAVLYQYFAAAANRTGAQMALGYRHMYGIGVPQSCAAAVLYYTPAAEAALASGPGGGPLGSPAPVEKVRLTAEYATAASARARERDMVAYYRYSAEQ
jgi:SEL1 protein